MLASFTFLTPDGALLALLAILPVTAFAWASRRVAIIRSALGLPPPRAGGRARWLAPAAVVVLLALAAMQPVIRTQATVRTRADAQVFVVLDTSRSMAAAPSPTAPTRLDQAKTLALSLQGELGGLPLGVATFTDRVLPDLFPTADRAAYDSTVESVSVEDPPPREVAVVATNFAALVALGTQGFFPPSVHRRAVILITDGESAPFDAAGLAASLKQHATTLAVVRVGGGGDRVWTNGRPEAGYLPDPSGARTTVDRVGAAFGHPPGESAASIVRRAVGSGPTVRVGAGPRSRTLAPYVALLAVLPLAFAIGRLRPPRGYALVNRNPGRASA